MALKENFGFDHFALWNMFLYCQVFQWSFGLYLAKKLDRNNNKIRSKYRKTSKKNKQQILETMHHWCNNSNGNSVIQLKWCILQKKTHYGCLYRCKRKTKNKSLYKLNKCKLYADSVSKFHADVWSGSDELCTYTIVLIALQNVSITDIFKIISRIRFIKLYLFALNSATNKLCTRWNWMSQK